MHVVYQNYWFEYIYINRLVNTNGCIKFSHLVFFFVVIVVMRIFFFIYLRGHGWLDDDEYTITFYKHSYQQYDKNILFYIFLVSTIVYLYSHMCRYVLNLYICIFIFIQYFFFLNWHSYQLQTFLNDSMYSR